jgi:hypothetical protein
VTDGTSRPCQGHTKIKLALLALDSLSAHPMITRDAGNRGGQ